MAPQTHATAMRSFPPAWPKQAEVGPVGYGMRFGGNDTL